MQAEEEQPLVRIRGARKEFISARGGSVLAVDNVDFDIYRGEMLGLVGETGSGKTTLARMIAGLEDVSAGEISFGDINLAQKKSWADRSLRRRIQMVFQNPLASMNPRSTVGRTLARVLEIHGLGQGAAAEKRVGELLELVGLRKELASRYPHQLSGGQLQRIGLARAIAPEPELIVLDEPTSALDVSIQAQILQLLYRLQREQKLTFLFISHDLSVVRYLSTRMAVLYRGQLMEIGKADDIIRAPRNPYTHHLVSSTPRFYGMRGTHQAVEVEPLEVKSGGCIFYSRCPNRLDVCRMSRPPAETVAEDWKAMCFNPVKQGTSSS